MFFPRCRNVCERDGYVAHLDRGPPASNATRRCRRAEPSRGVGVRLLAGSLGRLPGLRLLPATSRAGQLASGVPGAGAGHAGSSNISRGPRTRHVKFSVRICVFRFIPLNHRLLGVRCSRKLSDSIGFLRNNRLGVDAPLPLRFCLFFGTSGSPIRYEAESATPARQLRGTLKDDRIAKAFEGFESPLPIARLLSRVILIVPSLLLRCPQREKMVDDHEYFVGDGQCPSSYRSTLRDAERCVPGRWAFSGSPGTWHQDSAQVAIPLHVLPRYRFQHSMGSGTYTGPHAKCAALPKRLMSVPISAMMSQACVLNDIHPGIEASTRFLTYMRSAADCVLTTSQSVPACPRSDKDRMV